MRISDWSSDVCSSDLEQRHGCCRTEKAPLRAPLQDVEVAVHLRQAEARRRAAHLVGLQGGEADRRQARRQGRRDAVPRRHHHRLQARSEEHTSELQSLMRISYAVFCLKKKIREQSKTTTH